MLYSIENRDDLEKLEELASLENQVKDLRLQVKLGKQNSHEDMKYLYQPLLIQLGVPLESYQKL